MKSPGGLIGAALLFWGYQTENLIAAAVMAVLIEMPNFIRRRFDFRDIDFYRIADLVYAAALVLMVILYLFEQSSKAYTRFLVFSPLIVFPLAAAVRYSTRCSIDARVFLFLLRRIAKPLPGQKPFLIQLDYLYLLLILISAGAVSRDAPWYFPAMFVFTGWSLLAARPTGRFRLTWVFFLIMAGGVGYLGQSGFFVLQRHFRRRLVRFLSSYIRSDQDPHHNITDIGNLGRLKNSHSIIMRVGPPRLTTRILLREATYNRYRRGHWFAMRAAFKNLAPGPLNRDWTLTEADGKYRLTIQTAFPNGRGLLKLPPGTLRVSGFLADQVLVNQYGAALAIGALTHAAYETIYTGTLFNEWPPKPWDHEVPRSLAAGLKRQVKEIGLSAAAPRQSVHMLRRHFIERFRYRLVLTPPGEDALPILDFLERIRAGHCEYFATAAVLLLRAAGIPARYAVGYSVHEFSAIERTSVVRASHAHAWAVYHDGGGWRIFDATPEDWRQREDRTRSSFQTIADIINFLVFRYHRWHRHKRPDNALRYVLLAVLAVIAVLIFMRLRRRVLHPAHRGFKPPVSLRGLPEIDRLEVCLKRLGFIREKYEPYLVFLDRLEKTGTVPKASLLRDFFHEYYDFRYNPASGKKNQARILKKRIRYICADVLEKKQKKI